jgi:hypothetical protein
MHVIDTGGRILYQDDHVPPKPTSDWAEGKDITYTRAVAVPASLAPGSYRIVAGQAGFPSISSSAADRP